MSIELEQVGKRFDTPTRSVTAIENVDLKIAPGTATSIVGPNGAGKSTLLKLIAGIDAPTYGSIRRAGRCASLIELGAGFHQDLSGRENLELGMALARMSKAKRRRSRSEIIEFSGVQDAMGQPLRQLSTGMVARLACSIAVHSDPQVILIDEVLAVGDASFQRQMLKKVSSMVTAGVTMVLVTHSLELAQAATDRSVWLESGRIREFGPADDVLSRYQAEVQGRGRSASSAPTTLQRVAVSPEHIDPSDSCAVSVHLWSEIPTRSVGLKVELRPRVGDDPTWMRSENESTEMRDVNLVATTPTTELRDLPRGQHIVELQLGVIPVTTTELELTVVLTDPGGKILDELPTHLNVGDEPFRPMYDLRGTLTDVDNT